MRRLFYVAVGVGVGVAVVRRAGKAARKLTPSGLAGSASGAVSGLGGSLREFFDDIRLGMAEREAELREALDGGADPGSPHRARGPENRGLGR